MYRRKQMGSSWTRESVAAVSHLRVTNHKQALVDAAVVRREVDLLIFEV
jgi:hypothetical protein